VVERRRSLEKKREDKSKVGGYRWASLLGKGMECPGKKGRREQGGVPTEKASSLSGSYRERGNSVRSKGANDWKKIVRRREGL